MKNDVKQCGQVEKENPLLHLPPDENQDNAGGPISSTSDKAWVEAVDDQMALHPKEEAVGPEGERGKDGAKGAIDGAGSRTAAAPAAGSPGDPERGRVQK